MADADTSLPEASGARQRVQRGWHRGIQHLVHPTARFHWLLGLRMVIVFCVPAVVSHTAGKWQEQSAAFALAGMVTTLFTQSLRTQRSRATHGVGLALLPLAAEGLLLWATPFHFGWVVLVCVTSVVVGLSLRLPAHIARYTTPAGFSVMILGALPTTTTILPWLLLGGLSAVVLTIITHLLTHPALRLPTLSPPAVPPAAPERLLVLHNGIRRVTGTIIASVTIWSLAGGSDFQRHSYWLLYSVWIVLQQPHDATFGKGFQRVVGTLVGVLLTVSIIVVWPTQWWPGWLTMVLTFVAWGLWRTNYSWFVALFAPVVLLQLSGPEYDPETIKARVAWTLVGAALAMLLRWTMWPSRRVGRHAPPPSGWLVALSRVDPTFGERMGHR